MLEGLQLLNTVERREVSRLIGLDPTTPEEEVPARALAWMAKMVGAQDEEPEKLERAVLEWVAQSWEIDFHPSLDTNDLERLIRRRIAAEATAFLAPAWRVACALTVAEPSAVADSKYQMLEHAARMVVPSQSILDEHRKDWARLAAEYGHSDPREGLRQDLSELASSPGLGRQALRLGLVIALADGRLSHEEEKLARDLGPAMGVSENDARNLTTELNQLFWKHRNQLPEQRMSPQKMALVAAEQALVESGALEGLANEARDHILHEGEEDGQVESGWTRLMGALSGLSQFFSTKMDNESQAHLTRIIYLTIQKQRAAVVERQDQQVEAQKAEQAAAERQARIEADPPPAAAPPPATLPPVTLQDTMSRKPERRSISLEP